MCQQQKNGSKLQVKCIRKQNFPKCIETGDEGHDKFANYHHIRIQPPISKNDLALEIPMEID